MCNQGSRELERLRTRARKDGLTFAKTKVQLLGKVEKLEQDHALAQP